MFVRAPSDQHLEAPTWAFTSALRTSRFSKKYISLYLRCKARSSFKTQASLMLLCGNNGFENSIGHEHALASVSRLPELLWGSASMREIICSSYAPN
jgi:hypothetical protein